MQRFTPLLIDAARLCRHAPGDRWFVDETYVKVSGRWMYLYRAIDQFGQVIDVMVSQKRDLAATGRFFTRSLDHGSSPIEVTTDRAAAYPRVLDELAPAACHVTEQYGNNSIEADYGRLNSRLRAMRGLKQLRCVQVITAGHAFIQNIRRGHYELGVEETVNLRSGLPSTSSSWRSDQPRLTILPASTPHNASAPRSQLDFRGLRTVSTSKRVEWRKNRLLHSFGVSPGRCCVDAMRAWQVCVGSGRAWSMRGSYRPGRGARPATPRRTADHGR